jgi:hypothetical protein
MRLQRSSSPSSAPAIHDDLERALDDAIAANEGHRSTVERRRLDLHGWVRHAITWFTSW